MSLINRLAFSNISNLNGKNMPRDWSPRFRYEVLEFNGQSVAINLVNGGGKTTIAEALLAVLSRDRSLVTKTRGKFSPKLSGTMSHFQVELIIPSGDIAQSDLLVTQGAEVNGERWVFGMCGYGDLNESTSYYYYKGTLEQLPIGRRYIYDDKVITELTSDKSFAQARKEVKGFKWNLTKYEWQDAIKNHISPSALKQLVTFQKKGGSDTSAQFYDYKKRQGEKSSTTFFYEVLAPYIMSDVMGKDSEEDEEFLEDTLDETLMKVVGATREAAKKAEEVNKMKDTALQLKEVAEKAEAADKYQTKYQSSLQDMATDVYVLQKLTQEEGMPGIPKCNFPEGIVGEVAKHVIIEPGSTDIRITDRGLSVLLNIKAMHVNQLAERNRIFSRKLPQVIDIPCDNKRILRPSVDVSYDIESSKKLLKHASKFTKGVDSDKANEIIDEVDRWFESVADTNSYRKALVDAHAQHDTFKSDHISAKKVYEDLLEEKRDIESQQKELKENEAIYNDLCRAGCFSEEELKIPAKTKLQVEQELKTIRSELVELNNKKAKLEILIDSWKSFESNHHSQNPHEVKKSYKEKEEALNVVIKERRDKNSSLKSAYREAKDSLSNILAEQSKLEQKHNAFQELVPYVDQYNHIFKDENPNDLDTNLLKEKISLQHNIANLHEKKAEHESYTKALEEFKKTIDKDLNPGDWLDKVNHERSELTNKLSHVKETLGENRRKLDSLENERIAAGSTFQKALERLKKASLTHKTVHQFIQDTNLHTSLKEKLLSSFSALLFSPVLVTDKDAYEAVRILDDSGLDIPVFIENSLETYCKEKSNSIVVSGKLFIGLHAGFKSRQVQCLLDPSLIQREKLKLIEEIKKHDTERNRLEERLKIIDPEGYAMTLGRKANKCIEENHIRALTQIRKTIENTKKDQKRLEPLLTDEALTCIKKMQLYQDLGGSEVNKKIKKSFGEINEATIEFQDEKKRIYREYEEGKSLLEKHYGELENVFPQEIRDVLSPACKFWDMGGIAFFREKNKQEDMLTIKINKAEKRHSFQRHFTRAQSFLDANIDVNNKKSIRSKLRVYEKKISEAKAQSEKAHKCQLNLKEKEIPKLKEIVKNIDFAAHAVLTKHKKIAKLSADIELVDIESESLDSHKVYILTGKLSKLLKRTDKEDQDAINNVSISLLDEARSINIEDKLESVKRYRRDAKRYVKEFTDVAAETSLSAKGLGPTERDILAKANSIEHTDSVLSLNLLYNKELTIEDQRLLKLKEGAEGAKKGLSSETAHLIRTAALNLNTLRKITRFNQSDDVESHFIVNANIIDKENALKLVDRLIIFIEDEEEKRDNSRKKGLGVPSDDDYKQDRRSEIRKIIYRSIFSMPSVKFVNENIRNNKKEHDFDVDQLSEGEKTALSLMWTIRLSEFAIAKETETFATASARRKNKNRSESILLVDGLFSNLSEPSLIKSVMSGIENVRGRFQLIGLMHHPTYENDFKVFPVFLIGKKNSIPGKGNGWVNFRNGSPVRPEEAGKITDEVNFAKLAVITTEKKS